MLSFRSACQKQPDGTDKDRIFVEAADDMSVVEPLGKASFGQLPLVFPGGSEGLGMIEERLQANLPKGRRVLSGKTP